MRVFAFALKFEKYIEKVSKIFENFAKFLIFLIENFDEMIVEKILNVFFFEKVCCENFANFSWWNDYEGFFFSYESRFAIGI